MYQTLLLSSYLFILHVMGTPPFMAPHGRRVCGQDVRYSIVMTTESYVQPVHKPYITLCQGHRLCSTYKTAYSVRYRQVSKAAPSSHFYPECCPGWRRLHSHHCNHAVCVKPCVNGGTCVRPNLCACPLGWKGYQCQTDVDECKEQQPCAQTCVNTLGSYQCACREGSSLTGDGRSCQSIPSTPPPAPLPSTSQTPVGGHADAGGRIGLLENVTEEVQSLKSRVELLEKVPEERASEFSCGVNSVQRWLCPSIEATDGAGPLHQRLPSVAGRGPVGENHLTVPLLPAARSHRLPQRADRLSGGASGHVFLSRELACEDTQSRARIFSPKKLPSLQKRAVPRFSMAPCTSPDFTTVLSAGSIPSLRHRPDIRGSNCPLLFLRQCVLNQCSCVLRRSRGRRGHLYLSI